MMMYWRQFQISSGVEVNCRSSDGGLLLEQNLTPAKLPLVVIDVGHYYFRQLLGFHFERRESLFESLQSLSTPPVWSYLLLWLERMRRCLL